MMVLALAVLIILPQATVADGGAGAESLSIKQLAELSAKLDPESADLVVKGKLANLNPALFDLATLKQLPATSFITTNHWTGAKEKYTGVAFIDLLMLLGLEASATSVEVLAINDYRINIRISDLKKYEYVLSYALDDKDYAEHEPAKNKGPIAVAINFDKHPELDRDIYKHQLVWFVNAIIVE